MRTGTVADALVATLAEWDVRYVFGVSGANIEHLHDAIHRQADAPRAVQSVLTRSEVGAAFMADGRGRVRGTLGVCCATSGGGMMNLAVGLAESYADGVPVLAIVGQPPTAQHGRGAFQDGSGIGRTVNAEAMFATMSKYVATVDANNFWQQVRDAAEAALSGRPGPAVLLVPRDVFTQAPGDRPADFPRSLDEATTRTSRATDDAVDALTKAIADAQRPVVVAGPGARNCPDAVERFAEHLSLPVVTTMRDLAAFSHEHPLYRGVVGAAGHPSAHAFINDRADLVIAIGTTLDVMARAALGPGLERARLAAIDVDTEQIDRSLGVDVELAGDIESTLTELIRRTAPSAKPASDFVSTRYVPVPLETTGPRSGGGHELSTFDAVRVVQRYVPRAGHLLFDAGNCAATAVHHLDIAGTTTTTIALGQGGMGYAIAAGVGVALDSAPGEQSMVLCGDGAFMMLGTEVHTAVDLGVPLLFVVFNDNKHGMCSTRQDLFFDGRDEAVRYADLDIAGVARGFGDANALWVRQARTPRQALAALAEYYADGGRRPGVLELKITIDEMPPFAPFLGEAAETMVVARRTSDSADVTSAA